MPAHAPLTAAITGQAQRVVPGEVVVPLRPDAVARLRRLGGQAGVVAAPLGVAGEGVAVATDAEGRRAAGDDHRPDLDVGLQLGQDPPVLGVHPPGPRVVAVRPVQPDRRHPVGDLEAGGLQLHSACSTGSASSGRQTSRSGSHGSGLL